MQYGKKAKTVGVAPAIVLSNPKYAYNVGAIIRAASCFGVNQVWYTGDRISLDLEKKKRLPREERMKGYKSVDLIQFDYPFDAFNGVTPVAIELMDSSEKLVDFEHPINAIYVFGPEDGGLGKTVLRHCHRFVTIPSHHCLNLSAAVYVTLYDRMLKLYRSGFSDLPELNEDRGFIDNVEVYDGGYRES